MLTRYLVFYKQGKVEAAIVTSKGIGMKTELVLELQPESEYNAITGSYETRMVQKQVQKFVNTPPEFNSVAWKGTYEIRGKSVYLDFPSCTIEANISSGSLKGVATYKGSKEKEAWILAPLTSSQNNSSGGNSPYPNVVRNANGNLSPANGYHWVNPNDPKDFRVEPTQNNSNSGNSNSNLRGNRLSDLTGDWEGTYVCGQGLTNLKLSISQSNSFEISAVFKFSANRSNPSVLSGSYRMIGTYDSKTNEIKLRATDWINQPSGYMTVDLAGKVSQGNTKISGDVINSSCSTFSLEKR